MTIPQHDLTKQWNCYMFFHRGHETHFSAMKYSLFLLPKLECFIITDNCIFLFFASRVSLVLRWVQQSSGTCFNRWVTCIWMQLRLHNNLILISMDFLMETLRSRMMTSRNTFFFLFLDCEFTLSTYSFRVIRQIFYEKRKRKLPCDGLFSRFPFHFIFNYFSFSIPFYFLLFLVLAFLDKGKERFTNLFSATAERSFQTLLSLRFIYLVFIQRCL